MRNLATLVFVGALTLQEAQALKCPFTKVLEHLSEMKRHVFNWGKLNWPNPELEEMKAYPIEALYDMFTPGYMEREFKKCPVMQALFGLDEKKAISEKNNSPFYADPTEIPFNGTPTAVFHGLGDACIYRGMRQFTKTIAQGTGQPAVCIDVGIPSIGEMLVNFEEVAKKSCDKLKADSTFANAAEFNVVGLSQGGLLARYMVEECDMPGKVRNMVTLGGPHMGVDKVPNCLSGILCDIVNSVADALVYNPFVQKHLSPAGYFRNVKNLGEYERRSVFLPALNNEMDGSSFDEIIDV